MAATKKTLAQLLAYFEERVDLDHVANVRWRHRAALAGEALDVPPLVCYLRYEGTAFTPYPYPEAFADPAKMMVNELLCGFTSIYHAVDLGGDEPYCLRPNFGTGVVASMFGARIRLLEDNMPWAGALTDRAQLAAIGHEPLPDVLTGLGARVVQQYEFYHEALAKYPRCQAAFELTLPDLQGPFDTAELLWGSSIYEALYVEPETVERLLGRVTEQMIAVHRALMPYVRDRLGPGCLYQHAAGVRGNLLIRSDSAIMLSPRMYRERVMPHDARLARELGGVGIHFCGNGGHQVENMLSIDGVLCLDFGQPEMMDLDAAYARAAAAGKALVRLEAPDEQLTARAVRERFPRGVNLVCHPRSVATAKEMLRRYRETR